VAYFTIIQLPLLLLKKPSEKIIIWCSSRSSAAGGQGTIRGAPSRTTQTLLDNWQGNVRTSERGPGHSSSTSSALKPKSFC